MSNTGVPLSNGPFVWRDLAAFPNYRTFLCVFQVIFYFCRLLVMRWVVVPDAIEGPACVIASIYLVMFLLAQRNFYEWRTVL